METRARTMDARDSVPPPTDVLPEPMPTQRPGHNIFHGCRCLDSPRYDDASQPAGGAALQTVHHAQSVLCRDNFSGERKRMTDASQ